MSPENPVIRAAIGFAGLYSLGLIIMGLSGFTLASSAIPLDYTLTGGLGLASAWALWLATRAIDERTSSHSIMTVLAIALVVSSVGALLWHKSTTGNTAMVGGLPVITSTCYAMLGAALLLVPSENTFARLFSTGIAYTALAICVATLFALLFAIPPQALSVLTIEELPWAHLPVIAAVATGLLSLNPDNDFPQCLYSESAPATQLRLVLPTTIAMPLLLGLLVIQVGDSLTPATAVGITAIGMALVGVVVVVASAKYMAATEQELFDKNVGLEKALQREEAARRKADSAANAREVFVSFVAHELRAPLNAALTWLDLMALKPDTETLEKGSRIVRNSIDTQIRLIQDLGDIGQVTSGQLSLETERFDIREALVAVIEELEPVFADKDIELSCDLGLGERLSVADGDPIRLQQVVRNLLVNACRYTPAGGSAAITADVRPNDGQLVITVSDTGKGIKPENLEKVFEPYWRANNTAPGLGIGLALARAIVEAHDGRLSASSDGPDKGATFTVALPVVEPQARTTASAG
ncbi:MAG: HAMP domain-containing sensor histidine kinase [Gammaproteobacteria bacterium]|jgi:signal transduction histidine kinase|nr:HAMP domain-containing sensor histidine kinase [Gammaproteobacteria bacterium]